MKQKFYLREKECLNNLIHSIHWSSFRKWMTTQRIQEKHINAIQKSMKYGWKWEERERERERERENLKIGLCLYPIVWLFMISFNINIVNMIWYET